MGFRSCGIASRRQWST